MKLIPMPEPGDKVSYLGEGDPEHGVVVESADQLQDDEDKTGNTWQIAVRWDSRHYEQSLEYAMWNEVTKSWITT